MTDTILIVENIDLENLKNIIKKHQGYKIFCLSYSSHRNLSASNMSHEIGEFFLSENDKSLIDQKTLQTVSNWYNKSEIQDLLEFEGINLGSLIEMELLHYFLTLYRNALTIYKIIEIEKPIRVVTASYLNDFVKKICDTKSIELTEIMENELPSLYFDKINIKFNIGKIPISFHISRVNFNKIKKIFDKVFQSFRFNPESKFRQKSIVLVDFNPVIYDELFRELAKLDKDILLLNQRRPAIWNLQSFKIIKNSKFKVVELDMFQKYLDSKSSKLDMLSENLQNMWKKDHIFNEIFQIDSIPLWASIKNSFIQMCTFRFQESARRILLLNEFIQRANISAILEWAETGKEEKELLYLAKQYQIPKLMLQHNLFPISKTWENYDRFVLGFSYPFLSDKQIVWDELTKIQALSAGIDEENILLVGSPKHDKFFKSKPNHSKGIVLLATTAPTNFSIEMTPFESYVKYEEFIREVCTICKKLPDIKLIVKPHPQADYYTKISSLIREIDSEIQILYDADLVELIGSCDLLITFNNSTIALESIMLNKPTISLQFEQWATEDYIVKMNALLSISEINQVENGIKNLLYDKNIQYMYQNNRNVFLDKFVNRGFASKELAKVLDKL